MTSTKDSLEVIRYSLDNGSLKSPTVNINGEVYFIDEKRWKKKTFQFKQDPNYLEMNSIYFKRESQE